MLRYYSGAVPGKPKRKQTNNDNSLEQKRARCKLYEEKRKRVFCSSWLTNRSWLKYDDENEVMTCTLCIKHCRESAESSKNIRGQGTFITGSYNLKKSAVEHHENSKGHVKAVELENAANRSATDVLNFTRAGKALQKVLLMKNKIGCFYLTLQETENMNANRNKY